MNQREEQRLRIFEKLYARGVPGGLKTVLAEAEEVFDWVQRSVEVADLLGEYREPKPAATPPESPVASHGRPGRPRRVR